MGNILPGDRHVGFLTSVYGKANSKATHLWDGPQALAAAFVKTVAPLELLS